MGQKKVLWPLVAAAVGFVAIAAQADVTESFEGDALGSKPTGWDGYCAVSNNVGAYAKATPGAPLPSVNHNQMLSVEGSAVRTYTSETGDRVVDLLVMAEELPDEELPTATGDEHIKFAFDTNGFVNLYHKLASGDASAAWRVVSSNAVVAGTWVRTTFTFDYVNKLCQLKLDGSPCVSSYGYRSPTVLEHPGSWYVLAKSDATELASIDFVGCGGVDDVVNAASATYTPAHSGATETNGVDYAWFDKYGLEWSDGSAKADASSAYTIKDAFEAGTDPYSSTPLYVANAEYTVATLTLTINGYGPTYDVQTNAVPFTDGTPGQSVAGTSVTSNSMANTTTWEGPFPTDNNLTYYRVRNAASKETVNQFAIMKITSSATNTLFALPWNSLSADTNSPTAITVANVVMTKNLVDGDHLLYFSDGVYKGWVLSNGAWTPIDTSFSFGTYAATAADETPLMRGQAMWLVRNGRDLTGSCFYLYGQYQSKTDSITVASEGSLLASPNVDAPFDVSASGKITGAQNGDQIKVPSATGGIPKLFERRNGEWGVEVLTSKPNGPDGEDMTERTWTTSGPALQIPAGQGFMYLNNGSSTRTINW